MIITGFKYKPNKEKAIAALRKHMFLSEKMAADIILAVESGTPQLVKDDFVLREELEDSRFTVSK